MEVLLDCVDMFWEELDREAFDIRRKAVQEYASSEDRLKNFKIRALLTGLTPRQVLISDLGKHFISIAGGVSLREPMRGRIIDAMNYLRLLAYMENPRLEEEEDDELPFSPKVVYPPYPTTQFQKCPTFWDYKKRWDVNGPQRTAKMIGTAVAIGLEHHYKELMGEKSVRDALGTALDYVGRTYREPADKTLQGVKTLVARGYNLGCETELGIKEILAVEKYFGRIKPDLVARDYDGALIVIDHKVKVNLDDKYMAGNLQEYDTDNQFFHYAWAIEQEYGEPVERVIAHVIILAPVGRTLLHPVKMESEHVQLWLKGTSETWTQMQAAELGGSIEARFSQCKDRYGLCEMYEGCHTLHGDESAFPALYERT